jgi:DNA-binding transcriptional LysR family regulator
VDVNLEIRQLAYATALARHGNFSRAAEELGITQPTLSRGIQVLEDRVGGCLFDRLSTGVVPTKLGTVLVERGEPILRATVELESEIAAILGLRSGELRVAVGPYFAHVLLGPVLGGVLHEAPRLRVVVVEVDTDRMREVLPEGDVDVLVGEMSLFRDDPSYETEPLRVRHGEYVCRPGHPLLEQGSPGLEDLLEFPFATTQIGESAWKRLAAATVLQGRHGSLAEGAATVRCQSLTAIKALVARSDAIGIFSTDMIRHELADGSLAIVPFEGTKPSSDWGIIRLRGRTPSPAVDAFVRAVRQADAEVPA